MFTAEEAVFLWKNIMEKECSWKYLQINRGKKIIFDAAQIPFLKPPPHLSDLGESISVAERFKNSWPVIAFGKACLVDGTVLIQDITPDDALTQAARKLNETSSITLQVVDGINLTKNMVTLIEKSGVLDTKPLIIYPGNGAQSVKNFIASIDKRFIINTVNLPTQRTMIRNGEFDLSVDYSPLPQSINTDTVLIIDDVVASGQTAQTIASEIKSRFTDTRCILATWMFTMPTKPENKKSPSGVMGIDQTLASMVLKGNLTSRPPINSLSCFIRSENKYEEMKANFLKKYITNQQKFRQFISSVEEKV